MWTVGWLPSSIGSYELLMLKQSIRVHTLTILSMIYFNIILIITYVSPKWFLPAVFEPKIS
jgi:hypothetical protein